MSKSTKQTTKQTNKNLAAATDKPIPYRPTDGLSAQGPLEAEWDGILKSVGLLSVAVDREASRTGDVRLAALRKGVEVLCEVLCRCADGDNAVVDIGARRSEIGSDVNAVFRIEFTSSPNMWTPEERKEMHNARLKKETEIFQRRIDAQNAAKKGAS